MTQQPLQDIELSSKSQGIRMVQTDEKCAMGVLSLHTEHSLPAFFCFVIFHHEQ